MPLYTLEEILIIGNYQEQIKFSECKEIWFLIDLEKIFVLVTLDMYRMLQAVERQPGESITQSPANHEKEIFVRI
jgi:hypothetical protein